MDMQFDTTADTSSIDAIFRDLLDAEIALIGGGDIVLIGE